jgi:DNA polymerase-3 subunit beta
MKTAFDSAAPFTAAVTFAGYAIPAKIASHPLNNCMRLTVEPDGKVTVAAFDYEVSATMTVQGAAGEPGDYLIPGRKLADMCRLLPDGPPLTIHSTGTALRLSCGQVKFGLPTVPELDKYPVLPDPGEVAGTVKGEDLLTGIRTVGPAAGDEPEGQVRFDCVEISFTGEAMVFTTSDRYRFARREIAWEPAGDPVPIPEPVLLPADRLKGYGRAFPPQAKITVTVAGDLDGKPSLAGFSWEGGSLTSRVGDGHMVFPGEMLTAEASGEAAMDADALLQAAERAAVIADRNPAIDLAFSPGLVEVSGSYEEDGYGAGDALPVSGYDDGPGTVRTVNPDYLTDAIRGCEDERIRIEFVEHKLPIFRVTAHRDGPVTYSHVLVGIKKPQKG